MTILVMSRSTHPHADEGPYGSGSVHNGVRLSPKPEAVARLPSIREMFPAFNDVGFSSAPSNAPPMAAPMPPLTLPPASPSTAHNSATPEYTHGDSGGNKRQRTSGDEEEATDRLNHVPRRYVAPGNHPDHPETTATATASSGVAGSTNSSPRSTSGFAPSGSEGEAWLAYRAARTSHAAFPIRGDQRAPESAFESAGSTDPYVHSRSPTASRPGLPGLSGLPGLPALSSGTHAPRYDQPGRRSGYNGSETYGQAPNSSSSGGYGYSQVRHPANVSLPPPPPSQQQQQQQQHQSLPPHYRAPQAPYSPAGSYQQHPSRTQSRSTGTIHVPDSATFPSTTSAMVYGQQRPRVAESAPREYGYRVSDYPSLASPGDHMGMAGSLGGTHSDDQKPRKRRGNLPKETTDILRTWFLDHISHPYPSEDEKQAMVQQTGLQMNQISNWFINARRRHLPNIVRGENGIVLPGGRRGMSGTGMNNTQSGQGNSSTGDVSGSSSSGAMRHGETHRAETMFSSMEHMYDQAAPVHAHYGNGERASRRSPTSDDDFDVARRPRDVSRLSV